MTHYGDVCFFVKVVDSGDVKTASCQLGVSQSTILRKVAMLEKRLKNQLIRRESHKISLTEFGKRIYKAFKDVNIEIENFIRQCKA